jgi:hypothetical protein
VTRGRKPIIQTGCNRCGTRTLQGLFLRVASRRCTEMAAAALSSSSRARAGRKPVADSNGSPLRLHRHTVAITDMRFLDGKVLLELFRDSEYMHDFFPGAYHTLNTRNRESWIRSRIPHDASNFLRGYQSLILRPMIS